jgi:hypothetical protein
MGSSFAQVATIIAVVIIVSYLAMPGSGAGETLKAFGSASTDVIKALTPSGAYAGGGSIYGARR